MRIENVSADGARLHLGRQELLILANTLNLALHGLDATQFATVIGADQEEARALWEQVGAAYDGVADGDSATPGGAEDAK